MYFNNASVYRLETYVAINQAQRTSETFPQLTGFMAVFCKAPNIAEYNIVPFPGLRTKTKTVVKVEKRIFDTVEPVNVATLPFEVL